MCAESPENRAFSHAPYKPVPPAVPMAAGLSGREPVGFVVSCPWEENGGARLVCKCFLIFGLWIFPEEAFMACFSGVPFPGTVTIFLFYCKSTLCGFPFFFGFFSSERKISRLRKKCKSQARNFPLAWARRLRMKPSGEMLWEIRCRKQVECKKRGMPIARLAWRRKGGAEPDGLKNRAFPHVQSAKIRIFALRQAASPPSSAPASRRRHGACPVWFG